MVNLCYRLARLFGQLQGSDKEVKDLVKSLKDLIPIADEAILLKVKISLLEQYIATLEGKQKRRQIAPGIM